MRERSRAQLQVGFLATLSLPEIFKQLHFYLYANSNIPRAERLGAELIKLLFCKIFDELKNNSEPQFIVRLGDEGFTVAERLRALFRKVKEEYADVFTEGEQISLNNEAIHYVVEKLQQYRLSQTNRDTIGEAFQAFWGPSLRGEKGQFFTPKNIAKLCVEMLNPQPKERVIDPACGVGGFLVEVLAYFGERQGVQNIYGIDKEAELVHMCKAHMAAIGGKHDNIFHADSLQPQSWSELMKERIYNGHFDILLTNPPFGARIFVHNQQILRHYALARQWRKVKSDSSHWKITEAIIKQAPQVLFLERCLQLLKPGGKMAIVLPDGVFGNPSDRYIWQWIREQAKIVAIISLSPETFLPSTHTKTSILFLQKWTEEYLEQDYNIFMAIACKVGHDKNGKVVYKLDQQGRFVLDNNGKKIIDDELPEISLRFKEYLHQGQVRTPERLGFTVRLSEIKNYIFVPGYYNPETVRKLQMMSCTGRYKLISIGELINQGLLSIKRGNEIGSMYYGLGNVPFVRTTDIVNWGIKINPIKSLPEEIYKRYEERQDVRENDVLIITDGTFLIGRTAIVTALDQKLVLQSHIRRIRCLDPKELHPYLLLYLLNLGIVQRQIAEKTFVQATISTLGERLYEVILPISTEPNVIQEIISKIGNALGKKVQAQKEMEQILFAEGRDNGERQDDSCC